MTISIIIPTYNEEKVIKACLDSLDKQSKKIKEMIVVDDGSTDKTLTLIKKLRSTNYELRTFLQAHHGPGAARNYGAKKASGDILVFVDADMTFDQDFIKKLTTPIKQGETKGTFTRQEYVSNWNNVWARCWNYNQNLTDNRRLPADYPKTSPVFRAIMAAEFQRVGGYDEDVGWTDDWSLSQKLGYQATETKAVCYHANPSTLREVFEQARWIGKNEYISGAWWRVIINSVRHTLAISLMVAMAKSLLYRTPEFVLFKPVYDFGITLGIYARVMGKQKNK